jgi:tRNA U34 5-methylaminomethyl-2-thiouridine-forming methyltransferase MnmC
MVIDQPHALDWRDGVPVSRRFDDPFYSLEDGLAEARHVFLGGNDLPARFRDGFHIAELGFGTGLNFAATALAWQAGRVTGRLHFTSFEAFPLAPEDLRAALAGFRKGPIRDP